MLYDNHMDTFPEELCVLFANTKGLVLENNLLRTLPARFCLMNKLQWYAVFGRGC